MILEVMLIAVCTPLNFGSEYVCPLNNSAIINHIIDI
jgi:hypothetical protein